MHRKDMTKQQHINVSHLTLDFVRHGEPEGGTKYRGSQDDPLSVTGWKQIQSSVHHAIKQGTQWDEIITSPMLRCNAFAAELSEELNIPLSVEANLRELAFGDLEGMTPKEAWKQYPTLLASMWKNPEQHTPPNGEPFKDFCDRTENCIRDVIHNKLAEGSGNPKHILVIAHGGVIRAMLHRLLGISPSTTFQFDIPFAAITRIVVYPNQEASENESPYTISLKFLNGILPLQSELQPPPQPYLKPPEEA